MNKDNCTKSLIDVSNTIQYGLQRCYKNGSDLKTGPHISLLEDCMQITHVALIFLSRPSNLSVSEVLKSCIEICKKTVLELDKINRYRLNPVKISCQNCLKECEELLKLIEDQKREDQANLNTEQTQSAT